uniref:Hydroxycinnamoyltransferase 1-like n=1 Tax=Elaeis guineensis var. tenera TaxID=51953 RepID=A0A6J0PE97_ELAGV|nr:hydroxycinnamoyltransferase 1-like [Elaeis guineensis]
MYRISVLLIDHTHLRTCNPPVPSFPHIKYHPPSSMKTIVTPLPPIDLVKSDSLITAINFFKFTRAQLYLKAKAPKRSRYNMYTLFATHVWRCTSLARELPSVRLSKLYIATDGRQHLQLQLPTRYFWSMIFKVASVVKLSLLDFYGNIDGGAIATSYQP